MEYLQEASLTCSGADITITNGDLFQTIAIIAHLKNGFKKSDRIPVI